MQKIITFVGADFTGKTHISRALGGVLNIPVYKAHDEHALFTTSQERFLMNLRYADPARLDIIKQTGASVILDRGYPCEAVYSQFYERETDERMLEWLDEEYSRLGAVIIHCFRTSYDGIVDDLDPKLSGDNLMKITNLYNKYLLTSRCRVLNLCVDKEDLVTDVTSVVRFMVHARNS